MPSLAPVLSPVDLPAAELQAARLDGDVYPLGDGYCLIGELEAPRHRARAVLGARSPRLIAELTTAAWIWGATGDLGRLRFAVTPEARTRLPPDAGHALREIVYAEGDLADLDGCRVTTPVRTILDLLRLEQPEADFGPIVRRLAELAGLGIDDCRRDLDARPGLPARALVAERLERAFGDYAVETR